MHEIWNTETRQAGSVLAVALHDGHLMRPDLLPLSGINEATRLREEDPFTADWTNSTDIGIVATRPRFETDLNRPRDKAVYLPCAAQGASTDGFQMQPIHSGAIRNQQSKHDPPW